MRQQSGHGMQRHARRDARAAGAATVTDARSARAEATRPTPTYRCLAEPTAVPSTNFKKVVVVELLLTTPASPAPRTTVNASPDATCAARRLRCGAKQRKPPSTIFMLLPKVAASKNSAAASAKAAPGMSDEATIVTSVLPRPIRNRKATSGSSRGGAAKGRARAEATKTNL